MENFGQSLPPEESGNIPKFENSYHSVDDRERDDDPAEFTPEETQEINAKLRILSSLALFIGRDFRMPVELNRPDAGWHWDFANNVVRADPRDLLDKPMEYLRFVISHEGGHRRISRTGFIPTETWRQPGFSFMMNAIEDPRDNNFVAENYPTFREQLDLAYKTDLDFENRSAETAIAKLGHQPRFMQAGFEYIKQWFHEHRDEGVAIDESLPEEVREVVATTLKSARRSWWTYPSRAEADSSEELIVGYAEASYKINLNQIWPEFQRLVERDLEDQRTQELLDDMRGEQGNSDGMSLPQELNDRLTPEEQQELEDAIEKAIESAHGEQSGADDGGETDGEPSELGEPAGQGSKPINLDTLSPGLRQKIKDFIDSLPEDERQELQERARMAISEFERELSDEIGGKMSEDPNRMEQEPESEAEDNGAEESEAEPGSWQSQEEVTHEQRERRRRMEATLETTRENPYERTLETVSGLIDNLTADLRDVFARRKVERYESGYRSGRRWNIRRRIAEKIAGIPLLQTEAREQRESESEEMDYAITLMIDLSGSMNYGDKIEEAFKSAVVLAETLNNLGINFEIVGFQDTLLEFKSFADRLDENMREKLSQLILEVSGRNPGGHNNPSDNDDGVCLSAASDHLADQTARNKFLIVISDGVPETRGKSRSQLDRELRDAIAAISTNTNQKLIGLGLNSNAVSTYYENNIAGVSTEEMVETLGGLLREIIATS